jgi:hypothetical protein
MSQSLKLLASSREARRDAAIAKLAAAKAKLDAAYAVRQQARDLVEQSTHWRAELLARCTLGKDQSLRETLLPSCEALLQKSAQILSQRQVELSNASKDVAARRQDLMACERDMLRLQEWQQLLQHQALIEQVAQENRQDDEQVPRPLRRIG